MQIGPVVTLRETVDEDLPVAPQFGLELIYLVRPVEGISLDAVRKLAEERTQRFFVVCVEVDEDEAFPNVALNCGHAATVGVEVEQQIRTGGGVQ